MSVLNKKPFIKTLLESMTMEDLKTLLSLMDGGGDRTPILRTLNTVAGNGRSHFSDADLGVHMCSLQVGYTLYNGYFIMNSEYSILLQFTDFQRIQMFQIDVAGNGYQVVDEYLDINELRSELDDTEQLEGLDVVGNQATTTVIKDALTNINGRVLSSYEATLHEGTSGTVDYTYYNITKNGEDLTEEEAVTYMEYMTGSKFLPIYNYQKPQNSLLVMADNSVWKPQFMTSGEWKGLFLFKLSDGGGLPNATAKDKVLVSDENLKFAEKDSVPLADNLTSSPEMNDAIYSAGPAGGLADIATGQEAYLQEVKGYSIVWNQLIDSEHSHTCDSNHRYILWQGSLWQGVQNSSQTISASSTYKLFDLTLMFGGNDKIPFSWNIDTEYEANGGLVAQKVDVAMKFQRLFANVNLRTVPYDAGTIKNVKATKIVETGQNLWDESMETTGLKLIAGYRYEVYLAGNSKYLKLSTDGSNFAGGTGYLARYQRADGKYIWICENGTSSSTGNVLMSDVWIKSYNDTTAKIVYVGLVHSGNYCLTTGTVNNQNYAKTDATIPAYTKYEFAISGIDGLNGIPDSSSNHCSVYDTKDMKRVESIDLSTLTWTAGEGTFSAEISGIKEDTTHLLATKYLGSEMSISGTTITITAAASPTGTLLYELAEPVPTGESAFEPIALKSGDNWIVNDMGSEYFIQPENTNCPVNQVSYYIVNLKDKIINLQVPKIEVTDWIGSATQIGGFKINDKIYKIIPGECTNGEIYISTTKHPTNKSGTGCVTIGMGASLGGYSNMVQCTVAIGSYASGRNYSTSINAQSDTYEYSVAVGYYSVANAQKATAIGSYSSVFSDNATAIGFYASAGNNNVAIGHGAKNYISGTVTFDGTLEEGGTSTDQDYKSRIIHFYNPTKIFFRNAKNGQSSLASYASGHYLSEYIQNRELVPGDNRYWISFNNDNSSGVGFTDTFIKGVHITLKLSTNVVVGLDLLPYDTTNSQAFTGYGIASDTPTFVSAYIDLDGAVNITLPSGVTIVDAFYNIR